MLMSFERLSIDEPSLYDVSLYKPANFIVSSYAFTKADTICKVTTYEEQYKDDEEKRCFHETSFWKDPI